MPAKFWIILGVIATVLTVAVVLTVVSISNEKKGDTKGIN